VRKQSLFSQLIHQPGVVFQKLLGWVDFQRRDLMDPSIHPRKIDVILRPIAAFVVLMIMINWQRVQLFVFLFIAVALLLAAINKWFRDQSSIRKVSKFKERPRI
jgi:hypothetical protein